jgi:NAD(P)-dependent dehydrogenase (short-subunit alcohol dehydrogenase family)
MPIDPIESRTILVTGAGSGIGLALARQLAQNGNQVVGTVRDSARAEWMTAEAREEGLPLVFRPLELCDPLQIERLANEFFAPGILDVLVHNAGYGLFGALEEVSDEAMRMQYETNLLGPISLTRRLLPSLRASKGRIIWVGSMGGRFALPYQAHYSATKAAVAAVSDALRMELKPFGVSVTCVEPVDFSTGFTDARVDAGAAGATSDSPYAEWAARCLEAVIASEREAPGPDEVVRMIEKAVGNANVPARLPVGPWARTFCMLQRLLPDALRERIIRATYKV